MMEVAPIAIRGTLLSGPGMIKIISDRKTNSLPKENGNRHGPVPVTGAAAYSALTEIFFISFIALAVLGRLMLRTPFLNSAFTLSGSISEGSGIIRLNEP